VVVDSIKICYIASRYRSHNRAAAGYRQLLYKRYGLVPDLTTADIVVLHYEPHLYGAAYERFPELKKKYVIAYCVWEADELPEVSRRSIELVQEVWTPSRYCLNILARYHPNVVHVPHLIERDIRYSVQDVAIVKRAIDYRPGCFYFLSITKADDRRKNAGCLVEAFQKQCQSMPNARLVVKTLNSATDAACGSQIVYLPVDMTNSQISALYDLADVYCSAHHSEAWGLTLSDAMLFRKLVIATGYSGNLEFMDEDNSILLDFSEEYIHGPDQQYLFDSTMKWAYPKQVDLERKLLLSYQGINEAWAVEKRQRAPAVAGRFDRSTIDRIMARRIDAISTRSN
jgi:hypothetical protein